MQLYELVEIFRNTVCLFLTWTESSLSVVLTFCQGFPRPGELSFFLQIVMREAYMEVLEGQGEDEDTQYRLEFGV